MEGDGFNELASDDDDNGAVPFSLLGHLVAVDPIGIRQGMAVGLWLNR